MPDEADTAPALTAQQAIAVAEQAVPGSVARYVDLGTDDDRIVWEVLVQAPDGDVELYVDAATCEIVSQEDADW